MRQVRRFTLGFLLIAALALSTLSSLPVVHADTDVDVDVVVADESAEGVVEAVVDSTGDIQVEVTKSLEEDDDSAVVEAVAENAAEEASQSDEESASAEAVVVDEIGTVKSTEFVSNVRAKAVAFADKAKEITPEQMKKVALGALGIWGVAAGAGWVMNNLGGAED